MAFQDTNRQGLTADEMNLVGDQTKPQDTVDVSTTKPGELITGAKLGTTPENNMIAPTQKQYQAFTKPLADISTTSLSPEPAKSYLDTTSKEIQDYQNQLLQKQYAGSGQVYEDIKSGDSDIRLGAERTLAAQKEQDLLGMAKQASGETITEASKNAYISQLPPSDGKESRQEQELRNFVMSGGGPGISAGQALTTLQELRKERIKLQEQRGDLTEQQKSQMATRQAAEFYGGRAGGSYADATIAKLKDKQTRQLRDFDESVDNILTEWRKAAAKGSFDAAEKFRNEANRAFEQRMQIEQLAMQEQAQAQKMKEYEDDRSIKAQDRAMNTIGNLVKAGFTADQLSQDYLDEMDVNAGMPKGFSKNLFDISQKEQEAQNIKDEAAAKKADVENATAIFKILKDVPAGQPVTVGENTYFGTQGTGTVEISKQDGHGRMAIVDQETGDIRIKDLGLLGSVDPAKMVPVYVNGVQMLKNAETGAITPLVQSGGAAGDAGWDQPPPGGGKPLAPEGARGGQCGAFIHNFVENYPYGVSSIDARKAIVNVPKTETPRIGDVLLTSDGAVGHSAMVNWVGQDENGKTLIKLTESNWKGDERIMNTRTILADSPSTLGFFRGQLRPQAETGSDLPAVYGPTKAGEEFQPVETGATQADIEREAATVTAPASPFLQGVLSESDYQEGKKKESMAQSLADDLYDDPSTDMTGVPYDVKLRARELLQARGGSKPSTDANSQDAQTALDIFNGTGSLQSLPAKRREAVGRELAKLRNDALAGNDFNGVMRSSAGGKDVSDAFIQSFTKGVNVISQIGELQSNIQDEATGPIEGLIRSNNPYDKKAQLIKAQLTALVPNLARGVYGEVGVLTDQDVALYSKTLPNLTSTEDVNKLILGATIRSVQRSLENQLETQANAGRDVSGYVNQYNRLKKQADDLLAPYENTASAGNTTTITSPDGKTRLQYDLSDPAQKSEYLQARAAGYK